MPSWGYDKSPVWFPTAIATESGWINPDTNEVLVAIRQLRTKRREYIDERISQLIIDQIGDQSFFLTLSPDDGDRPIYLEIVHENI
jgi:hypothetical protein